MSETIRSAIMMQSVVLLFLIGGALSHPNEAKPAQCCDASLALSVGALTEKVANVIDKMAQMETRLDNTEKELTELKNIIQGTPKVAFSASLYQTGSGDTGPFNVATPLKYKNVFSNFGNNYNPATGIFTSPIKGVFYFRFTMHNTHVANSIVSLVKNGVRVVSVWDTVTTDANDIGSNAAVLSLEAGDTVYVELVANREVYDDTMNYNTFSGFLLFRL
ncbi:hypothetical protein WMY93_003277 [Mugilogobius chulae]|uniref:C1q domain-containing protein n=1 Tax=Mugilogobius chulae TaxID=88201 RepID=A0AAW0QB81_9GOBI